MTTFADQLLHLGGVPVAGGLPFSTGNYFFVHSGTGNSSNAGKSSAEPTATVAQAVSKCTDSKGDIIIVMPGHTEAIIAADTLDVDKIGVTIVCVGEGDLAPTFTFGTATAATITFSAASCTWQGGAMVSNLLDVASAFTLGAAKGTTIQDVFFEDGTAILNFLSCVTTGATDNDADDMTVKNCVWYGLNTTPLAFVSILAATLRPVVEGCKATLAATSGGEFITLAAKVVLGARFVNNEHVVIGATDTTTGIFLTGSGTSTGIVKDNFVSSLDTTTELIATAGTGLVFHENYYTGTADKSGKLWPVVDGA